MPNFSYPLWPSLYLIQRHWSRWLYARSGTPPWMPSVEGKLHSQYPVVDILLAGRLYDELIDIAELAPAGSYRLWTLGSAGRLARIAVAGFHPQELGQLPRYEAFPMASTPSAFPASGLPWSLVYSGRPTRDKGFAAFLKTASALQVQFREPVTPVIFGVLERNKDSRALDEARQLRRLLAELPWHERPHFYTNLGPEEWLRHPMVRPVLFCFSSFINDEFSATVAQAQAQGWPTLLSHWGAHLDVTGANSRRFEVLPSALLNAIATSRPSWVEELLASMRTPHTPSAAPLANSPESVDHLRLREIAGILSQKGVQKNRPWPAEILAQTSTVFGGRCL